MKILITLFLVLSLSTRMCLAQSIQDNEWNDSENSLLWKISGNGLQHDSFLFGTMHNVDRTFLDSISGFRKAFKTAKQIAVECDIFTYPQAKKELKDYAFMPNDTTYAMLYNHDNFQFIDSALKKYTPAYSKYKPMFWCSMLTTMAVIDSIKNRDIRSTLDGFILLMGYQNDKKIHFMETLESIGRKWTEYDSLSYAMDLHYQAKCLQRSLEHPNEIHSFLNQMRRCYFK